MVEQHRRHSEHWEGIIGQIALMLYSANKKADAPDMTLTDFTPSARKQAPAPKTVQYATIADLDSFLKRIPGTRTH